MEIKRTSSAPVQKPPATSAAAETQKAGAEAKTATSKASAAKKPSTAAKSAAAGKAAKKLVQGDAYQKSAQGAPAARVESPHTEERELRAGWQEGKARTGDSAAELSEGLQRLRDKLRGTAGDMGAVGAPLAGSAGPLEEGGSQPPNFRHLQVPPVVGAELEKVRKELDWPFRDFDSSRQPGKARYDELVANLARSTMPMGNVIDAYNYHVKAVYPEDFHNVSWGQLDARQVVDQMRQDHLQLQGLFDRFEKTLKKHGGEPESGTPEHREFQELLGLMKAYNDRLGDGISELGRRGLCTND